MAAPNILLSIYHFIREKKNLYILVFVCILLYLVSIVFRQFMTSLFMQPHERVTIVVYNQTPTVYSVGVKDVGDYAVLFYPDLRIRVPESYGRYRVGALGKLVYLEDNPDIFQKSFTADVSTFVDYYFFNNSDTVYYGEKQRDITKLKPGFVSFFLQSSNASFFDRLYMALLFNSKRNKDFEVISYLRYQEVQGDKVFSAPEFTREFQGLFYQSVFREENKNVQILYSGQYYNASSISSILVGTGIRVSDISWTEESVPGCIIQENVDNFSDTSKRMAEFFSCELQKGTTDIYDILFILGDIEDDWNLK